MHDRSLIKFNAGIRSEATKEIYDRYLNYFLRFVKIKEANGLLQLKDSALQEMAEDYIIHLKSKGLRKSSIDGQICALELFFAMNDKPLNFKKIRKMSPSQLKTLGGEAWTNDEIERMLGFTTNLRNKAIIHFLASTGCRIGALPSLRIKHVADIEDCKSVLFYEGSTEEYMGFLTPEASKMLEAYLELRRKDGEYLTQDSPLFRNIYRVALGKAKPMTLKGYKSMMHEIVKKLRGKGNGKRYGKAMFHAFRHRYNTILKDNRSINISLAEKMMGHFNKLVPLDTTYHNPSRQTLFEEFRKAIPDLVVDSSERQKLVIKKQEAKISEMAEKQKEIEDLRSRLKNVESLLDKMK